MPDCADRTRRPAKFESRSARWPSHCPFCLEAPAPLRMAALSIALSLIVRSGSASSVDAAPSQAAGPRVEKLAASADRSSTFAL